MAADPTGTSGGPARNTWWRRSFRSPGVGYLSLVAGALLLASSTWRLGRGEHSTFRTALDVLICVLAILMLVRAVTGLAAMRRRT